MRISINVLVVFLFAASAFPRLSSLATGLELDTQNSGLVPDPGKRDMMRLWFAVTTSPTPPTPSQFPALNSQVVNDVAGLVSDNNFKTVVSQYQGWHGVVGSLAVINGVYNDDIANRIWILAVSRQDLFNIGGKGLKSDITQLFSTLNQPLPSNADATIHSINKYVSRRIEHIGGKRVDIGNSFTQVRIKFGYEANKANIGWPGGGGHPTGVEAATNYP